MKRDLTPLMVLVLAWSMTSAHAASKKVYGALAVAHCSGTGRGYGYPTPAGARERALNECRDQKGQHCRIVATLERSCAAIATDHGKRCSGGPEGHYVVHRNLETARKQAVDICQKSGGTDCRIVNSVCSEMKIDTR